MKLEVRESVMIIGNYRKSLEIKGLKEIRTELKVNKNIQKQYVVLCCCMYTNCPYINPMKHRSSCQEHVPGASWCFRLKQMHFHILASSDQSLGNSLRRCGCTMMYYN